MQQLIGAEPKDLDDLLIEPIDRPLGECGDEMVERRPPALHADGNVGRERAIALVVEAFAREGNGGREIGAAG